MAPQTSHLSPTERGPIPRRARGRGEPPQLPPDPQCRASPRCQARSPEIPQDRDEPQLYRAWSRHAERRWPPGVSPSGSQCLICLHLQGPPPRPSGPPAAARHDGSSPRPHEPPARVAPPPPMLAEPPSRRRCLRPGNQSTPRPEPAPPSTAVATAQPDHLIALRVAEKLGVAGLPFQLLLGPLSPPPS